MLLLNPFDPIAYLDTLYNTRYLTLGNSITETLYSFSSSSHWLSFLFPSLTASTFFTCLGSVVSPILSIWAFVCIHFLSGLQWTNRVRANQHSVAASYLIYNLTLHMVKLKIRLVKKNRLTQLPQQYHRRPPYRLYFEIISLLYQVQ